ncbi:hypothetical protein [Paenibacillus sp. GP183]|uniref:DUF6115 domain-containing protein n=1 Tax=Paenibacillus sp. GP183 TaxID=1882751 RepID=UPI000894AA9E|nr:hypothetical protein [Paenibacillus sp. GP183]SEB47304.1 hypothetical protein SAMN05443246_0551 [Paenibacillus sp. GP183]
MYPWMYVVLLGLVLIVYARLLPKSETAAPRNTVVQEIEETIEHFAVEMDEQNKAILDLFTRTKQDYEVELAKLSGRMELLEKQKSELSQELSKIHISSQVGAMTAASSNAVPAAAGMNDASVAASTVSVPRRRGKAADMAKEPEPSIEEAPPLSLNMKSRYAELFSLHDQGKGVEIIAKKLGMNKGEVNLIIQLSKQEERSRV